MSMSTDNLLKDLARSRKYRAEFVVAHAKHSIPLQIQDLLKQQDLTQTELAELADLSQGTVSRAADIAYGNLTINTLVRIAAGFDVAFVCGFVPFSRFLEWIDETSGEQHVATFSEEFGDNAISSQQAARDNSAASQEFSEQLQAAVREQQHQQSRHTQKQMAFNFTPQPEILVFFPKPETPLNERTDEELYGPTDPDQHRQQYAAA